MSPDDVAEAPRPDRSRLELALAIVIHALAHSVEEIPESFFGSAEEVAVAKSLTANEVKAAGAAVMQALAPRLSPPAARVARHLSVVWRKSANRPAPIARPCIVWRSRPLPRRRRQRHRFASARSPGREPDRPHIARRARR